MRLFIVLFWAAASLWASAATKPNIIFILADDLGYGEVGCFGQKAIQAPNLLPDGLDAISFAPALTGNGRQKNHEYLYWEFYEQGSRQAVRFGNWKAIREPMLTGRFQLFDLRKDLREECDLSNKRRDLAKKAVRCMDEAHVADSRWEIKPAGPNEIP